MWLILSKLNLLTKVRYLTLVWSQFIRLDSSRFCYSMFGSSCIKTLVSSTNQIYLCRSKINVIGRFHSVNYYRQYNTSCLFFISLTDIHTWRFMVFSADLVDASYVFNRAMAPSVTNGLLHIWNKRMILNFCPYTCILLISKWNGSVIRISLV